jgi:hypothetical protein
MVYSYRVKDGQTTLLSGTTEEIKLQVSRLWEDGYWFKYAESATTSYSASAVLVSLDRGGA